LYIRFQRFGDFFSVSMFGFSCFPSSSLVIVLLEVSATFASFFLNYFARKDVVLFYLASFSLLGFGIL